MRLQPLEQYQERSLDVARGTSGDFYLRRGNRGIGFLSFRVLLPLPDEIFAFPAIDETGNMPRAVSLEDLADPRLAWHEKYIADLDL